VANGYFREQVSTHDFVESIVIELDAFPGAGAFDVLHQIDFGIRLIPAIPGRFLIRIPHEQKILSGSFFLSQRSRASVMFHRITFGSEFWAL
jgi:hypothetical protein